MQKMREEGWKAVLGNGDEACHLLIVFSYDDTKCHLCFCVNNSYFDYLIFPNLCDSSSVCF